MMVLSPSSWPILPVSSFFFFSNLQIFVSFLQGFYTFFITDNCVTVAKKQVGLAGKIISVPKKKGSQNKFTQKHFPDPI